jgi:uncharacterized membrane protein
VGKGRLEAFSDGVFAVAITLLVLDLQVPLTGHGTLVHQLASEWPEYAAYVVSFMVIGIIWVNHHTLMHKLARVDRSLLFLNLLLLLSIVLIPFPTAVVAKFLRQDSWDGKVALAFYNAVMEAMSLGFAGIYWWAGRHPELLHESVDADRHRQSFRQFSLGTSVYVLLVGVAFVNAELALLGDFVLAAFYVFDWTATSEAVE